MKKISRLVLLCILSACNSNNKSVDYGYQTRPTNPLGSPTNPTRPFENSIIKDNEKITGMISRGESQVSDYIKYRLNEWDTYNPNTGQDISYADIANAALWLTDASKTKSDIEQKFADNITLMHMALYVIDNRLNSCFARGDVGHAATCFTNWRDNFKTQFNEISAEIQKNTTRLNVADAEIAATNNAQIKFIVDTDGRITGATVTENGTDTKYNAWAHVSSDDKYAILNKLSYNSIGKEMGLSYSDFGTYSIEREKFDKETDAKTSETLLSDTPFAGGYASQKIAKTDIVSDIDFTGRAIGNASNNENSVKLDGLAYLSFDKSTGTSTLDASFSNWYDISVNDNGEITFSNYSEPNGLVKLDTAPDDKGVITDTGAKMDVGYYAPNPNTGIPTEATGLIQYTEKSSGVKMDVAFGAK